MLPRDRFEAHSHRSERGQEHCAIKPRELSDGLSSCQIGERRGYYSDAMGILDIEVVNIVELLELYVALGNARLIFVHIAMRRARE